jgi:hypothetical protein
MATPTKSVVNPIALQQGEGEALWFFGALATIKASSETTAGRVMVMEHLAPQGSGSPLHLHHREDEWFYIVGGRTDLLDRGQDHPDTGRGLCIWSARRPAHLHRHIARSAQPGGHRACRVRKVHARTERTSDGTHDSAGEPSAAEPDRIKAAAAEFGLEILGPPGIPS